MSNPQADLETRLASVLSPDWVRAVRSGDDRLLEEVTSDPQVALNAVRVIASEGWLTPDWPVRYGGRALDPAAAVDVRRTLAKWRIGSAESAVGTGWVGPTLLAYGTEGQREELLPPIARNEAYWCQLFSESEAGSDLPSLRTHATRVGDHWVVKGGKIWTSRAHVASWGLALVRTDLSVRKHAGLTCFVIPMDAEGVTVEPIRQMTNDSEFSEVRLDDVRIPDFYRIGEEGQGWEIARAVLQFERTSGSGSGAAAPGMVIGRDIEELLREHLPGTEGWVRTSLIEMWVDATLIRLNNQRNAALAAVGRAPMAEGAPVNKILQAEHTKALQGLRMDLGGLDALVVDSESDPVRARDQWAYLRVQPKTIAGGTVEVLRDQIAERALGMPRSQDPSREVPWNEFLATVSTGAQ